MRTLNTAGEDAARYYAHIVYPSGTLTADEIQSLAITQTAVGSTSALTLGGAPAACITGTIAGAVDLRNREISVFLAHGTDEAVPMGVYVVSECKTAEDYTTFTGYDHMYSTMEGAYYPSDGVETAKDVLRDVAQQAGLRVVLPDTEDVSVSVDTGYTLREMAGYMAALLGGNARINDEGALCVQWFTPCAAQWTAEDVYSGGYNLDSADYTLSALTCTVTESTTTQNEDGTTALTSDTQTLTCGDGAGGLSLENPWMTQTRLDTLYAAIGGFTYRGGSVYGVGDLRLQAGDVLAVTDLSGTVHSLPIMSITQEYDGGLKTTLSAYAESTSAGDAVGPVTRAVERLTAQLGVFKTLQAENLRAVNASIQTLAANSLTADNLNALYLCADWSNLTDASIATLFNTLGIIDNLTVSDGKITGTLQAVTINADCITAGTLSADRLLLRGADGLIYELNAAAGDLTAQQLAEEIYQNYLSGSAIAASSITATQLAAGTITAQELAAQCVTAEKLNVESLSAISADLGEITGGSLNIKDNFIVTADGALTATDATISGDVRALRFSLNGTSLTTDTRTIALKLLSAATGSVVPQSVSYQGTAFVVGQANLLAIDGALQAAAAMLEDVWAEQLSAQTVTAYDVAASALHAADTLQVDGAATLAGGVTMNGDVSLRGIKPYYEAGDSISGFILQTAGFVAGNSTTHLIRFVVPLSRPIIGSPTVSVTISDLILRQGGSFTHGTTASTGLSISAANCTAAIIPGGLRVEASVSTTTNAVLNDVIGVHGKIAIQFS